MQSKPTAVTPICCPASTKRSPKSARLRLIRFRVVRHSPRFLYAITVAIADYCPAAHVTKAPVNQRLPILLFLLTMKYKANPLTIVSENAVSFSGLLMVERIAKTRVAVTYKTAMLEKTKR